jgi:tetratricopeptide (TPR) repeat protein
LASYLLFQLYSDLPDAGKRQYYLDEFIRASTMRGEYSSAIASLIAMEIPAEGKEGRDDIEAEIHRMLAEVLQSADRYKPELLWATALYYAHKEEWDKFRDTSNLLVSRGGGPCWLAKLGWSLASGWTPQGYAVKPETWLREADLHFSLAENSGMRGFNFYNAWGITLNELGNYEGAAEKYRKANDYYGEPAWPLLNWGSALYDLKRYTEAEQKFKQALSFNDDIANAIKGYLLSKYQVAINKSGEDEIHGGLQRFTEEVDLYERKTPQEKKDIVFAPVYAKAGLAHCKLRNTARALEYVKKLVKLQRDIPNSQATLIHNCLNKNP